MAAQTIFASSADARVGSQAALLAGRGPGRAVDWLRHQRSVQNVQVGLDGQTVDIRFVDGAELFILPAAVAHTRLQVQRTLSLTKERTAIRARNGSGRALVLEPFATELGLGPDAGQPEVNTLAQAGFRVDLLRNGDVTVSVMQNLANYSFIYMETHSGILPDGDIILQTGETNTQPYKALFEEGSLGQGFVAGDASRALYVAIKAKFVTLHMGTFPSSSILFINGCSVLKATKLLSAFQAHNVATIIGWDDEADSTVTEPDAQAILTMMLNGQTVKQSLDTAASLGFASSVYNNAAVHLTYVGNGENTLQAAQAGVAPNPTPTSTSTPPAKAKVKKCKKGYKRVHGKCRKVKKKK